MPWRGRRCFVDQLGAQLVGVIGALIALAVAAIYPSIEKIWFREALPEETVREHKAIE